MNNNNKVFDQKVYDYLKNKDKKKKKKKKEGIKKWSKK